MAFTVKGEYDRLIKIKSECERKTKDKKLGFECGVACGYVTRIEYQPGESKEQDEAVLIYAIAGWDIEEKLVLVLRENDVSKRYPDRKYRYYKQWNILESFVR